MRLSYNKRLACLLLLVMLALVAMCCLGANYLQNVSAGLLDGLADLEPQVQAENWPQARQTSQRSLGDWQAVRRIWLSLLPHQDVINIDTAFISMQAFLQEEKPEEVLNQLALLQYHLTLVAENEKLNWHNFF